MVDLKNRIDITKRLVEDIYYGYDTSPNKKKMLEDILENQLYIMQLLQDTLGVNKDS